MGEEIGALDMWCQYLLWAGELVLCMYPLENLLDLCSCFELFFGWLGGDGAR